MVNRVLLGQKGSAYGLWVSKSGYDVTTATNAQMLFTSEKVSPQVMYQTTVYFPARNIGLGGIETVTHADFGFRPFVILTYSGITEAEYESSVVTYGIENRTNTQFQFTRPGVVINKNTQFKAFTLEYRLLSVGPDTL